jgi:hypothetical protein
VAEKFVHQVMPRIIKRTGKHLLGRVLWRKIARGLAIAIPAIGGIFAVIITIVDLRRARQELSERGNRAAFLAFRWAAFFDVIDVFSHVFIAFGLGGFFIQFTTDPDQIHQMIHAAGMPLTPRRLLYLEFLIFMNRVGIYCCRCLRNGGGDCWRNLLCQEV